MRAVKAIDIAPGRQLLGPIKKGWHSRSGKAYIVRDAVTNSIMLASKLSVLAEFLNQKYARNQLECVSVRGLYEAADIRQGSYTGGLHKMRYAVSRCELDNSHVAFTQACGEGFNRAMVITEE